MKQYYEVSEEEMNVIRKCIEICANQDDNRELFTDEEIVTLNKLDEDGM